MRVFKLPRGTEYRIPRASSNVANACLDDNADLFKGGERARCYICTAPLWLRLRRNRAEPYQVRFSLTERK